MQASFIQAYPKLLTGSIPVAGLWLAHGDEPLLHQWLIEALRPEWRRQHYEIRRIELVSVKTWQEVLAELGSQSLFDEATAVIVTGNHKPDQSMIAALERFALEAQSGAHSNSLLWLLSKQDKRAQRSKWFTAIAKYAHIIDCHVYDERARQQLLQIQAQQFGLQLSQEAWQLLMSHTEHHLLGAYQSLWRLSYLYAPELTTSRTPASSSVSTSVSASASAPTTPSTPVDLGVDDLQAALVSDAQFSVFDLSDAMLAGNSAHVVKILYALRATDEPPTLVLWAIAKDMRHIMALMSGQDPQSLGIWRNKQGLYQQACRRQHQAQTASWPDLLYRCDQAIKGLIHQPVWELLLQAALQVTGVHLFASSGD